MDPAVLQAMQEELEIDFDAASTFLAMHVQDKAFTDAVKLELYGLFKHATVGPCNVSKPFNPLDFKARSKWCARCPRNPIHSGCLIGAVQCILQLSVLQDGKDILSILVTPALLHL